MKINPAYLTDVPTAEVVLEILLAEPDKRLELVNRCLRPVREAWEVSAIYEFANAAMEAFMFMEGKPAYKWLNDDERGFDLLKRVTGYRP